MSLTVIAVFDAARGKEDALRTALEAMIEPSLDEPGCLAYQPYVDPNRPGNMVIIEEWTDRAALERHFGTPHFEHVARQLETLLSRPFTLRHLTEAGEAAPAARR
ncbi:putative quinol monooxygenase [Streptomyces sp. JJ38]|uniref:putative quinol monooxygenase n=1 Tax=Streptomyces sp. JJ38 TaxID=2738128 RepID=UPI001C5A41CD|nr:putative quinol monooxygenase [Streptomyces sp. JJ38]MBW1598638.1 antibiotic biosynthesis monooxygenase [Streptomyces sp. JJ38]